MYRKFVNISHEITILLFFPIGSLQHIAPFQHMYEDITQMRRKRFVWPYSHTDVGWKNLRKFSCLFSSNICFVTISLSYLWMVFCRHYNTYAHFNRFVTCYIYHFALLVGHVWHRWWRTCHKRRWEDSKKKKGFCWINWQYLHSLLSSRSKMRIK